ncbi:MAG: TetR/AcrR family transcriptional regulator [Acetobacteraceae bacterium]
MPRPRAYDATDVLDRATALFWRQGYAATSVQELVEATGLNRASMYAAYGDKHGLFLAALDHYLTQVAAERMAPLEQDGPALAAIGAFLRGLIEASGSAPRLGCLLTNSLTECGPHDLAVAERLLHSLAQVEAALAATIRRGQAEGSIGATDSPEALAGLLLTMAQGLRVLSRGGMSDAALERVVDTALALLRCRLDVLE